MDTVVCSKCGQKTSNTKYCGNCGLPVSNEVAEKITTQQRNILLAMKQIAEVTPDHPSTIPKIAEKINAPVESVRTMMYQLKARGYTDSPDRGGYILSVKGKTVLTLPS